MQTDIAAVHHINAFDGSVLIQVVVLAAAQNNIGIPFAVLIRLRQRLPNSASVTVRTGGGQFFSIAEVHLQGVLVNLGVIRLGAVASQLVALDHDGAALDRAGDDLLRCGQLAGAHLCGEYATGDNADLGLAVQLGKVKENALVDLQLGDLDSTGHIDLRLGANSQRAVANEAAVNVNITVLDCDCFDLGILADELTAVEVDGSAMAAVDGENTGGSLDLMLCRQLVGTAVDIHLAAEAATIEEGIDHLATANGVKKGHLDLIINKEATLTLGKLHSLAVQVNNDIVALFLLYVTQNGGRATLAVSRDIIVSGSLGQQREVGAGPGNELDLLITVLTEPGNILEGHFNNVSNNSLAVGIGQDLNMVAGLQLVSLASELAETNRSNIEDLHAFCRLNNFLAFRQVSALQLNVAIFQDTLKLPLTTGQNLTTAGSSATVSIGNDALTVRIQTNDAVCNLIDLGSHCLTLGLDGNNLTVMSHFKDIVAVIIRHTGSALVGAVVSAAQVIVNLCIHFSFVDEGIDHLTGGIRDKEASVARLDSGFCAPLLMDAGQVINLTCRIDDLGQHGSAVGADQGDDHTCHTGNRVVITAVIHIAMAYDVGIAESILNHIAVQNKADQLILLQPTDQCFILCFQVLKLAVAKVRDGIPAVFIGQTVCTAGIGLVINRAGCSADVDVDLLDIAQGVFPDSDTVAHLQAIHSQTALLRIPS